MRNGGGDVFVPIAGADLARPVRRVLQRLDRMVAGPRWILAVVGLTVAVSVLMAWPTYSMYHPNDADWQAISEQADHPFTQPWGPDAHAFDSTFRMTVPLVGRVLGLGPNGYLVLQAVAALGLFAAAAHLVERITSDRRAAALTTISIGLMWAGATGFVEVRPNFDSVALALLVAAMATRRVPVVVLCGFLAGWTDERAIPAMAFVALLHHAVESRELGFRSAVREPRTAAAMAAAVLVIASRLAVRDLCHLRELTQFGGVSFIVDQAGIWPIGAWTGLEGLWVFAVLATIALVRVGHRSLGGAYAGLVVAFSVLAIGVVDVTRSMAYLLPAGMAGLAISHRLVERRLFRNGLYTSFALTVLWPLYYAGGSKTVYWQYPLPLVLLGWMLHVA